MSGFSTVRRHRSALALGGIAVLVLLLAGPALIARMHHARNQIIGGPFSLQDAAGKTVTDIDFRGKWMLVYFGYTHCPDSCPTALNDIAVALTDLGNHRGSVAPVFITIDPERDHGKPLQDYANAFDKDIVALSGTPAEIAAVEKAYRVYTTKESGKGSDYLMPHSSIIYVMDPDGNFVASFTQESDPQRIAAKLRQLGA